MTTKQFIIAILSSSLIPALASIILGFINRKAIKDVHVSLNSRLSELVKASFQSGRTDEIDKNRAREKEGLDNEK
jgi:hypothetical protein